MVITAATTTRHGRNGQRPNATPVLAFDGVRVWTPEGARLLNDMTWAVHPGEHWAVIGPNGAGKSTLLSVAATKRYPSGGTVSILGRQLGKTNVWPLRATIGVVDAALTLPEWLKAEWCVLSGLTGTTQPQWDRCGPAEWARARELLALLGCADLAERDVLTCSQGERQRIRIARALMPHPALLLLDEPATGLDLPAREALLAAIADLADREPNLATVVVAHHLEDLPAATTHGLLLRGGETVAAGPVEDVLQSGSISDCFGIPVEVERRDGRWSARAAAGWRRRGAIGETSADIRSGV